ncbi:MAG TPA: 2-C-methyl-D-erythritol 2,4-cyclodiphosphate synthase [Anaerohalosphaeraceae bacterium]|nr:2-C-methyl-D-erythritol 2,4-cyclodiphosphate synthase [Anaerohalosphaeraceae bacterium]HOL88794.1 2-C-methyl-D-erythritol 2,4-cyclodiphosphate synthase [Anaerohalosphaeraceae bacterium]HPP55979.1 2-C-methyl-D-erythritol 2,4-cyclodiphosphate synthase [Anaerohalosphaeraceae bacterium]
MDLQYEYRTGIGTDIHRLVPDRPLKLGGIEIPFDRGLLGHSDGDAALHALMDALLGAAGLGDIGMMYPDTAPQWKDADSRALLLGVKERLEKDRWEPVNIDLIVHAEEPKLGPFKGQMRRCIAGLLDIDFACVNVKAKTNEGLGEIGRGEAIAATAAVLLRRRIRSL